MDMRTIERLDKLQTMLHFPNKSGILAKLVDGEYRRQLELRDSAEE